MTKLTLLISAILCISINLFAQDFIRSLPDEKLLNQLTREVFKNHDAIIILKEQGYQTNDREVFYRGLDLKGKTTQKNMIIIAKLFTESAVKRYGNFEFKYNEFYGNEIPNGFEAKARVLKENGDIVNMPEENVLNIISRRTSTGIPLTRKVIFKIPDLTIGDVVQIEYSFEQKFARAYSGLFFYHEKDMILFSNLYITLPDKENVKFFNFPQAIGNEKVERISNEFGSGETHFWSLRNLSPIPDEIFSKPFADQSYITAFVIGQTNANSKDRSSWENLAHYYYEDYLDGDKISTSNMEKLGYKEESENIEINYETVDKLYEAIRNLTVLTDFNSLFPMSDDIDEIFETGRGDASDLAYIMFTILEKWGFNVKAVWVRDLRDGIIEESVPSLNWFDRIAIKVSIGNHSKFYDFDKSIPYKYEDPWYLDGVNLMLINKDVFETERLVYNNQTADNSFNEIHHLKIVSNELIDSVEFSLKGSVAQQLRAEIYNEDEQEVLESMNKDLIETVFSEIKNTTVNNFLKEKKIEFLSKGKSLAILTAIENNIAFKLKTHYIKQFYKKIYTTFRRSDLVFDTPFKIKSQWNIDLAGNYKIEEDLLKEKLFFGPKESNSKFTVKKNGNFLTVNLELEFPSKYMLKSDFPGLLSFIENTINFSEQNLVFKAVE